MINLFQRKPKAYRTPAGQLYTLFDDMAEQPHLLIAGATGSGKSVLVSGIIHNLLYNAPKECGLILIDPKRTELKAYSALPHVLMYADEASSMLKALQYAKQITDSRFYEMQRNGWKEYNGGDVYVIIDELAALMTTQKKAVLPILQYLGIIARAAHVHMIACTQTVKADVLPTPLTCNFDSRVALRTATAQQSRMIIDTNGCESFPSPKQTGKAYCYFRNGADLTLYNVPKYPESEIKRILTWWTSNQCIA